MSGAQLLNQCELLHIDGCLWVLSKHIGEQKYDFDFERFFPTRRPFSRPSGIELMARVGAIADYDAFYDELKENGLSLINNPSEHRICSDFEGWYEPLKELTPMSRCYDSPPSAAEVADIFGWPVFMKGTRQTSRHDKYLSIIRNENHYNDALERYSSDDILHWQKIVIRKFVQLRTVDDAAVDKIPLSFEFRCFFWKRELVAFGNYWSGAKYACTPTEKKNAIDLAEACARKINVPALVIDVAQTADGDWILIECNDAQESGYAELTRIGLWQNIFEIEKLRT